MKDVLILLAVALLLNGCGASSTPNVQQASGGVWQSEMLGGVGAASGLSFIAQFTVSNNGALSITNFQFLTQVDGGCFPVTGATPSGNLSVTFNSADQVSGTFSFKIVSGGNTLTLTSTQITGTVNGTNNTLSNGVIVGNWALTGGTGCNNVNGTFTMTQTSSD
jgi:heat shock protein HslJ